MFKWKTCEKLPCLWASSVFNTCSCDDMHHFCAYICQESVTFLQKGAVWVLATSLWPWRRFSVPYQHPSNSDIICVCWPILSPHLQSGWGIAMSISALCANASEELMCVLVEVGGGVCWTNLFSLPVSSPKQKQQRALWKIKKTRKLAVEYRYQSMFKKKV